MMLSRVVFSTLLILVALVSSESSLDDDVDRSQWIDPHDMGMPSPRPHHKEKPNNENLMGGRPMSPSDMLKRAHESDTRKTKKTSQDSMLNKFQKVSQCADTVRALQTCQERLRKAEKKESRPKVEKEEPKSCTEESNNNSDLIFFRRHVKLLSKKLAQFEGETRFFAQFEISPSEQNLLKSFAKSPESVALSEVDHILSQLFSDLKSNEEIEYNEQDVAYDDYTSQVLYYLPSGQDWFWLFLVLGALLLSYAVLTGVAIWKIFVSVLIVSSAWHWTHMYKVAMAKKHSTLVQNKNVPVECFPHEMSWSHFVMDTIFRSHKDKCSSYHEALMVDPFLEVSPTMAVAETITQFVLLPMEHLGKNIGRFFSALLGELTWASSPLILIFIFVALLLILVMIFGYKIRLPLFLGSLEPKERHVVTTTKESPVHLRVLEEKITSLQLQLRDNHFLSKVQRNFTNRELLGNFSNDVVDFPGGIQSMDIIETDCSGKSTLKINSGDIGATEVTLITKEEVKTFESFETANSSSGQTDSKKPKESSESKPPKTPVKSSPATPADLNLKKTPRKKLVAKGSLMSPVDTDFEWVDEDIDEEEKNELNCSNAEGEHHEKVSTVEVLEGSENLVRGADTDYLNKIQQILND